MSGLEGQHRAEATELMATFMGAVPCSLRSTVGPATLKASETEASSVKRNVPPKELATSAEAADARFTLVSILHAPDTVCG